MTRNANEPEVFNDVIKNGFHIYSLNHAKTPNFYPNQFPKYPGVKLSSLVVGDRITIRAFFRIGSGKSLKIDSGLIDLEVELIETDNIFGVIITELPSHFPLETGSSVEITEDEILYKAGATVH